MIPSRVVYLEACIETLKSDNERVRLALDEVRAELRLASDKAKEDSQLARTTFQKIHAFS